ncbi:hypothetical protein PWP00_002549, partial [Enterococcus faecium]|nr:hypothetical protein [Enterococcus faecium]
MNWLDETQIQETINKVYLNELLVSKGESILIPAKEKKTFETVISYILEQIKDLRIKGEKIIAEVESLTTDALSSLLTIEAEAISLIDTALFGEYDSVEEFKKFFEKQKKYGAKDYYNLLSYYAEDYQN